MSIAEGREVVKKFGDFTAVAGVSFAVKRGECFGILGPNGAGKTSLMRMMQCLSPITSGEISVDGKRVGAGEDREIKSVLGVVPQSDNLDPDLTVLQNLVVYASYFGIKKRTAEPAALKLLEFFHIEHKKDTPIRSLSGGMQRRLVLARALINDPKLLILDEPTTGLDPQARLVIWRKLNDLKSNGVSMILTTHYMEEAARLCDRATMMSDGKMLVTGHPDALVRDNIGDNVTEFIPRHPENFRCALPHQKFGETFYIYAPRHDTAYLADIEHVSMINRPATLEDTFIRVTGRTLIDEV